MTAIEFALLKQSVENLNLQFKRFMSQWDSEERGRNRLAGNVDLLQQLYIDNKKLLEKLDEIIRNGGKGLMGRVQGLERDAENNDKSRDRWIAWVGGLSGIAALVIEILRK